MRVGASKGALEYDVCRAYRIYQNPFYIPVIVLYIDNYKIVIVRVGINEVSSRENDYGPFPSLRGVRGPGCLQPTPA